MDSESFGSRVRDDGAGGGRGGGWGAVVPQFSWETCPQRGPQTPKDDPPPANAVQSPPFPPP